MWICPVNAVKGTIGKNVQWLEAILNLLNNPPVMMECKEWD